MKSRSHHFVGAMEVQRIQLSSACSLDVRAPACHCTEAENKTRASGHITHLRLLPHLG